MINVIPADKRHFSNFGWLKTYWLFSFSEYYDPENVQFGSLRVFNDDIVEPGQGFPTHPHREMEIITVVLDGEITHKDSMGNSGVVKAGEVQRMSAGRGLTHSEFNMGNEPLHLYQIWIYPGTPGLEPGYDQKPFDPSLWKNTLFAVASGQGHERAVSFHADATIYRADLETGVSVDVSTSESRKIFVYVTSGDVVINGKPVAEKDQARIDRETALKIEGATDASFVMIDVPNVDE
ncbi:MAG: pirin family protein [Candidatus Latescibacterota bacterium]|nr:MAG: pirin family protein [Candidatus Latescibacterota bacterium]